MGAESESAERFALLQQPATGEMPVWWRFWSWLLGNLFGQDPKEVVEWGSMYLASRGLPLGKQRKQSSVGDPDGAGHQDLGHRRGGGGWSLPAEEGTRSSLKRAAA